MSISWVIKYLIGPNSLSLIFLLCTCMKHLKFCSNTSSIYCVKSSNKIVKVLLEVVDRVLNSYSIIIHVFWYIATCQECQSNKGELTRSLPLSMLWNCTWGWGWGAKTPSSGLPTVPSAEKGTCRTAGSRAQVWVITGAGPRNRRTFEAN